MQAQRIEGHWDCEKNIFYPYEKSSRKSGIKKAHVFIFDEPAELPVVNKDVVKLVPDDELPEGFDNLVELAGLEEAYRRVAWLKRLEEARELAKDAPLFELPPRTPMKPPILFED